MFVLMLAQAVVSVPASPSRELPVIVDQSTLSLVIADTVSETDPQPLCKRDCNSLYLSTYKNAVTIAGRPVTPEFAARAEMGSPWNMSYRLALIVEHRNGREPLVRAVAGFGDQGREACFELKDTAQLNWRPESPRVTFHGRELCVTAAS